MSRTSRFGSSSSEHTTCSGLWQLLEVGSRGPGMGLRLALQGSPARVYSYTGLYTLAIVPFTLADPNAVPRDVWPCPALRHQDSMQEWGYRRAASHLRRSEQEPLHCLDACRGEGWYPQGEMGWAGGTGLPRAPLLPLLFPCLMQSEQKPGKSKVTPCFSAV